MAKRKYTKEFLEPVVKESESISDVVRKIGLKVSSGNHGHISRLIKKYDFNTDHFRVGSWNKGKTAEDNDIVANIAKKLSMTDEEVFCEDSNLINNSHLRKRLHRKGWGNKCSNCGLTEWLGEEITLHLDHINGIRNDNRLENLRFLCPNCHQQTETWGKGNEELRKKRLENNEKFLHTLKCKECDREFQSKDRKAKFCSYECSNKSRRKCEHPSKEELEKMLETMSWCAIGRKYNVSDNAVRKWAKKYGIL